MELSRDGAFLDEIAQLLESLDAADKAPVLPEVTPSVGETEALVLETSSPSPLSGTSVSLRRPRQRDEIEYLRTHATELETQLTQLRQSCGRTADTTVDRAWQRVAQRQMNAKQTAEAENTKLRALLQGQLKVARALEKLLCKRSIEDEIGGALCDKTKRLKPPTASDAAIYEQLQAGLSQRLLEVDAVVRSNGLDDVSTDYEDVRVLVGDDDAAGATGRAPITLEILHARVLPFDFARTSDAWKCSTLSRLPLPPGHTYAPNRLSEDDGTAKFEVHVQVRRQYVTVHVHMAMRRQREREKQRDVYAWETFSTVVSDYKPYHGLQASDHGWTIVDALPTRPDDPENVATIVKCCSRFAPDEQFLPRDQPIGAFSDFLIASYHRNYATLLETMEGLLLVDDDLNGNE